MIYISISMKIRMEMKTRRIIIIIAITTRINLMEEAKETERDEA